MGNAPLPPFTSPLGHLRPKGMFPFHFISFLFIYFLTFSRLTLFFFIDAAIVRPRLDKLYLDRIYQVRAFPRRTFHDLVTLSCQATWGLGPVPTAENLGHEETTHRSKYRPFYFPYFLFSFLFFFFLTRFSSLQE